MTAPPKRGHWPKGKRRHADRGDWGLTRLRLAELLEQHHDYGSVSIRTLAGVLNVDPKTICRWLSGRNRPDPDMQGVVAAWVREHMDRIKAAHQSV